MPIQLPLRRFKGFEATQRTLGWVSCSICLTSPLVAGTAPQTRRLPEVTSFVEESLTGALDFEGGGPRSSLRIERGGPGGPLSRSSRRDECIALKFVGWGGGNLSWPTLTRGSGAGSGL